MTRGIKSDIGGAQKNAKALSWLLSTTDAGSIWISFESTWRTAASTTVSHENKRSLRFKLLCCPLPKMLTHPSFIWVGPAPAFAAVYSKADWTWPSAKRWNGRAICFILFVEPVVHMYMKRKKQTKKNKLSSVFYSWRHLTLMQKTWAHRLCSLLCIISVYVISRRLSMSITGVFTRHCRW